MEQALREEVVQEQAEAEASVKEASAKEARVEVEWEERALEPGPAGTVSALIVEQSFLIR